MGLVIIIPSLQKIISVGIQKFEPQVFYVPVTKHNVNLATVSQVLEPGLYILHDPGWALQQFIQFLGRQQFFT